MSDFTSDFWGYFVGIATIVSILACVVLLMAMSTQKVSKDAQGKTVNTGHVWDEDLAELNNPLPRWWMWLFYITLVFAGGYLLLYPGAGRFAGTFGWSSTAQYDEERSRINAEIAPLYAKFASQDVKVLATDPQARAIGERLFQTNCAQCHGSDAGGAKGFPRLRDDDWLYGGAPENIKASITDGRRGVMPPLGAVLSEQDIWNVTHYVLAMSKQLHNAERAEKGKAVFQSICAACHGPEGKGNPAVGSPNLADNIWLYGGSEKTIIETITRGRNSMMPAHRELLEPDRIHLLTAYVYGLSLRAVPAVPKSTAAKAP
jgi:cytochrome c oxidase cbb3-type subunit III